MADRSLSGIRIEAKVSAIVVNTLDSGKEARTTVGAGLVDRMASGLVTGAANRAWESVRRELANAAAETLDLYDLTGLDIGAGVTDDGLGQDLIFEEITTILIHNEEFESDGTTALAGVLEIEGSVGNGWEGIGDHTVANNGGITPGGWLMKHSPGDDAFDMAAGDAGVRFTANGAALEYSVYIVGRHDDEPSSSSSSSSQSSSSSSQSSSSQSSSSSSSST
jgi:hypothetical protein